LKSVFGNTSFTYAADLNGDGLITDADATYDKNNDGNIDVLDAFRTYASIDDAVAEAGMSGIYGGIYFQSANQAGLTTGDQVATYVRDNYFQAIPEPSSALLLSVLGVLCTRRRRQA
jgi:hypothetical protein